MQFVKTETERKQAELQNVQLKLEHNEEKYKQHDSDLVPVLARITEISAIEQNIGNMLAEKAKLESRYGSKIHIVYIENYSTFRFSMLYKFQL